MGEMGEKRVQAEERKEAMLQEDRRHRLGVDKYRAPQAATLLCLL